MNPKKARKKCISCGKECSRHNTKFCSPVCHKDYENEKKVIEWITTGEISWCNSETNNSYWLRKIIRKIFGNKCCQCGWNKINPYTNKIPLELEHVDGDHNNNNINNLLLLCPNCHSLTKTFRALNKGRGRKNRKK